MIRFDRIELLRALRLVALASEARSTIPILTQVGIGCADGAATVQCRGLDMWISKQIEVDGDILPECKVSAARLIATLSVMDGVTVSMRKMDDGRLEVASEAGGNAPGRSVVRMMTMGDDWPETFKDKRPELFNATLPAGVLGSLFAAVAPAISTEETRYYLNGINLTLADGKLRAVATDGHRLLLRRYAMAEGSWMGDGLGSPIIPRWAIAAVIAAERHHADMAVTFYSGTAAGAVPAPLFARFQAGNLVIRTKLIDGTYPDWQRVVPPERAGHMEVDSGSLARAARLVRAGSVSSESHSAGWRALTLAAHGEALGLRHVARSVMPSKKGDGASADEDEAFAIVKGRIVGDLPCPAIGLNGLYLQDMAASMGPGTVRIYAKSPGDPMVFEGVADGLGVLMPMRVDGDLNWRPEALAA